MARRTKGEGSAYMRKDGRAAASAMYEGKRITKYGKTKTEAMQKLDAYLADLRAGKVVIGPKQTVEQYLTRWLEESRRLRIRSTTLKKYRMVLRLYIIPALGDIQLHLLAREHVQSFYAKLYDGGLASKTIKLVNAVLSSGLKDAVRNGDLARNVCEWVTMPKGKRYQAHALTSSECVRLIEAARGHRLWFFILMAITTGARRGELIGLKWSDIDESACLVHIRRTIVYVSGTGLVEHEPKTVHGLRSVTLTQLVRDGLEEQRAYVSRLRESAGSAWVENDLVFPNMRGKYIHEAILHNQFKRLLKDAGLPDMHLHDLRHSAATLLLAAGVNAKVVQEMLGHSDITITLGMYGHVMPNMQKEAASKMDEMLK